MALDDKSPSAHFAMGAVYLWSRQLDDAIREAERAIAVDPNFASAYSMLGLTFHYAGKSEETLRCLERGRALNPYQSDIYLHFEGQAYAQLGQYEKAVGVLKRRITRNPETDISRVLLASCYGHLGAIEEARAEWREALRINPDYSLEHRRKVLPYKNPEDFETLVDGLRKAGVVD